MVDTLHPVDAVAGAPAFGGRQLRQIAAVAFSGATATRPLGARTGVRPGTSATTVTATSTTWTCGAFSGVADVEAAAEAGLVEFAFDAVATSSMTAADATYPRTDIIYVQVDIPLEDGTSVPAGTRKYLAGHAGVGAPVPALPVSHAFVVAQINVPISGGGSPTVTWVAPYAVAAGGVLPVSGASDYPPSPHRGQAVDDAALGIVLRWNGTAWVGPWHSEFTAAASVPANTDWGPGALTIDSTLTHAGSPIVSPANDKITLPFAGVYAISLRVVMSAGSSGVTYMSLKNAAGSTEYVSFDVIAGNGSGTLNMPNFRVTAATDLKFYFRGGTAATWTSRIRVTKIG